MRVVPGTHEFGLATHAARGEPGVGDASHVHCALHCTEMVPHAPPGVLQGICRVWPAAHAGHAVTCVVVTEAPQPVVVHVFVSSYSRPQVFGPHDFRVVVTAFGVQDWPVGHCVPPGVQVLGMSQVQSLLQVTRFVPATPAPSVHGWL